MATEGRGGGMGGRSGGRVAGTLHCLDVVSGKLLQHIGFVGIGRVRSSWPLP